MHEYIIWNSESDRYQRYGEAFCQTHNNRLTKINIKVPLNLCKGILGSDEQNIFKIIGILKFNINNLYFVYIYTNYNIMHHNLEIFVLFISYKM